MDDVIMDKVSKALAPINAYGSSYRLVVDGWWSVSLN